MLGKGLETFSAKSQIIYVLGFVDHNSTTVYSLRASRDDMEINMYDCVPVEIA